MENIFLNDCYFYFGRRRWIDWETWLWMKLMTVVYVWGADEEICCVLFLFSMQIISSNLLEWEEKEKLCKINTLLSLPPFVADEFYQHAREEDINSRESKERNQKTLVKAF